MSTATRASLRLHAQKEEEYEGGTAAKGNANSAQWQGQYPIAQIEVQEDTLRIEEARLAR